MNDYLCHDFKSPRTDTSRRLPPTFRFIPIAFYLAVVAGACLITLDVMKSRQAKQDIIVADQLKAEHEETKAKYDAERAAIELERAKAEQVAKWVEGTRVIQPICVATARAIKGEVRLANFALDRSTELPAQMDLTLRLAGGDVLALQDIQRAIEGLNYRTYSPQQNRDVGMVDFKATLVFIEN
ncbi:MAG: hypothetical protein KDK99_03960 [Verrucomicrobiales bacterium]|nr:hypothetical protein [Verrucomicrobiales bacterium]